jgi:hypothetical protein
VDRVSLRPNYSALPHSNKRTPASQLTSQSHLSLTVSPAMLNVMVGRLVLTFLIFATTSLGIPVIVIEYKDILLNLVTWLMVAPLGNPNSMN